MAASVLSHSGEFVAVARDFRIPSLGPELVLIRSYRSSLANLRGPFGRGWSSNLFRRVVRDDKAILYEDGTGSVHRFLGGRGKRYSPPPGVYAVLRENGKAFILDERWGVRVTLEAPDAGGRLLAITDRNSNTLGFSYSRGSIRIVDSAKREATVIVKDGLWRSITDHADRTWQFRYDDAGRLVEVLRPATRDFPKGTSLTYGYDDKHRLASLTDAKGQTYLVNSYDKEGRIVRQRHGGGDYTLEYGDDRHTRCRLKNGGTLELDHDEAGHATCSKLKVQARAFSQEDLTTPHASVAIVTESAYNDAGELVQRRSPSGVETRWTYAEADADPRNRGNLLEIRHLPRSGALGGPKEIAWRYEYAKVFQSVSAAIDRRGNRTAYEHDKAGNLIVTTLPEVTIQPVGKKRSRTTQVKRTSQVRFEYDKRGSLVRRTDSGGAVTAFSYTADGQLARRVQDADGIRLTNTYGYDKFGNRVEHNDGKGNATRLVYNPLGWLESFVSRAPFEYRVDFTCDANGDQIESTQSFEHFSVSGREGTTQASTSSLREQRSYDELRNLTERRLVSGDKTVRERFIRDAAGRLVRQVQPAGNVTEYTYDERDLLIEKRSAVGVAEGLAQRFTYTLDGSLRSRADGDGNTTVHRYDNFGRYEGFIDPSGTIKHQSLDEAGNVVAVTVSDAERTLMEAHYAFDELNRLCRVDRAWRDLATGEPAGKSDWDGAEGVVSTIVEYAGNGAPARVWNEGDAVLDFEFDGCRRLTRLSDSTGQELTLAYDENGNIVELTTAGPKAAGKTVLRQSFDAMDRLELRQLGDGAPERFKRNALGAIVEYAGRTGLSVLHTHDALGRHTGHALALGASTGRAAARQQSIVRRYEYDDNYRRVAYVDAAGNRTLYKYDELDRQVAVVYPDGASARVEYDGRSRPVRVLDAGGRATSNRFDAAGRLVESIDSSGHSSRYRHDGAGRLVSAQGAQSLRRSYDTISNATSEFQGIGAIRYAHDSAGNLTDLVYPSGRRQLRSYDARSRLTLVQDGDGTPIASFKYGETDRVTRIRYGDRLEAKFAYDAMQRLQSVEYRNLADGKLVDGYRYGYDAAGMMTHELHVPSGSGERYVFDAARRPVRAEYGVADVLDPASPFERATDYEDYAEGRWSRRIDRDGTGAIVTEQAGKVDNRNRYSSFGKYSFTYDGSGNCIRKESANPGFCLYTYDDANRLIRVECYDATARLTQTIEYFYDALGRMVRKVVTNAAGVSTEYTYVWAGSLLAEEYENGKLARSYVYGLGANPLQLSSARHGADFTYVLNGRGLVGGIVRNDDPNAFAEKYGYEITGKVFLTEVDGVPVDLPSRESTISGLDNPLVTGDTFGSVMKDWASGTLTGSGGGHMDTTISDALNALGDVGSKGHEGISKTLAKQLQGLVGWLGLGGTASAPPEGAAGGSGGPDITMNPDWKLYADGDTGEEELTPPPLVPADPGGDGGEGDDDGPGTGLRHGDGSDGRPSDAPTAGSPPNLTPPADGSSGSGATSGLGGSGTAAEKPYDPSNNLLNDKINGFVSDHPVAAAVIGLALQAISLSTGGPPKMSDPDYSGGDSVVPNPDDLEAKFNRLKHPVNPNGGPVDEPIDTSSPPPQKNGPDPTVVLIDPDAAGQATGTSGSTKLDTAPIDHVPGWQPEPGTQPSHQGGGGQIGTDGYTAGWHEP